MRSPIILFLAACAFGVAANSETTSVTLQTTTPPSHLTVSEGIRRIMSADSRQTSDSAYLILRKLAANGSINVEGLSAHGTTSTLSNAGTGAACAGALGAGGNTACVP